MDLSWAHFASSNTPVLEKLIRTVVVYLFLLIGLRLAGKRELGQLNPFDLVVLLLLSNTLQNAIIGEDNSLLGGLIGGGTLLAINYAVVRFLYKRTWLEHIIEGDPDTLIENGKINEKNLKKNLITMDQLRAAARRQGIQELTEVESCELEVEGALTFIEKKPNVEDVRQQQLLERIERLEHKLELVLDSVKANTQTGNH